MPPNSPTPSRRKNLSPHPPWNFQRGAAIPAATAAEPTEQQQNPCSRDRNAESVLTRSSGHEKAEEKMQNKTKQNKKLQAHRNGLTEFGKGLAGKSCRMKTCFLHQDDSVFCRFTTDCVHFLLIFMQQEPCRRSWMCMWTCTQPAPRTFFFFFFFALFFLNSFTCSFPASLLTPTRLKSWFPCKLTSCTQRLCVQTRKPEWIWIPRATFCIVTGLVHLPLMASSSSVPLCSSTSTWRRRARHAMRRWSRWWRWRWRWWRSDQELDNFTRRLCSAALATCSAWQTFSSLWRAAPPRHRHLYRRQVGGAGATPAPPTSFPHPPALLTDSSSPFFLPPVFFIAPPPQSCFVFLLCFFLLLFLHLQGLFLGSPPHIIIQPCVFCQQPSQWRYNVNEMQAKQQQQQKEEKSRSKHRQLLI